MMPRRPSRLICWCRCSPTTGTATAWATAAATTTAPCARYARVRPIIAIGLAYTEQLVQGLPHTEHDEPLDWIVTERGAMPIAPRAA